MNNMNNKSIFFLAASLLMVGCAEERESDFMVEKPASVAEYEKLSAYEPLTACAPQGLKIATVLTPSEYTSKQTIYSLAIANFNELEVSGILRHS